MREFFTETQVFLGKLAEQIPNNTGVIRTGGRTNAKNALNAYKHRRNGRFRYHAHIQSRAGGTGIRRQKSLPRPTFERMLRLPQISSCITRTLPDSTRPIASAASPMCIRNVSFGKSSFRAPRQESTEGSSSSEMPEKSPDKRMTEKNFFIKILFR